MCQVDLYMQLTMHKLISGWFCLHRSFILHTVETKLGYQLDPPRLKQKLKVLQLLERVAVYFKTSMCFTAV